MSNNELYWMKYSIEIANKVKNSKLRVAALLVSAKNELICCAYPGEINSFTWSTVVLKKLKQHRINEKCNLYLTINTLKDENHFELSDILSKIYPDNIFVGVPDPQLTEYFPDDPLLTSKNIYRFPDDLQIEIIKQNAMYYEKSKQSIKSNIHYYSRRISKILLEKLHQKGIYLNDKELKLNKGYEKLSILISQKNNIDIQQSNEIVKCAISEAFDEKYALYNYENDVRSIETNWSEELKKIFVSNQIEPIEKMNIINVGVGGGNEALALFANCESITFVDIAPNGLKNIKMHFPHAKTIIARAENLCALPRDYFDLYISLRTYNSSFFDIKKALVEAYKVLKTNGVLILSIANGFLFQSQNCIIPGLIIPGTEFVDIYRGLELIKKIEIELSKINFVNTKIYTTRTELYILSKKE